MSFAGRVTLIKSVLSSLPIYYLSLFRLPNSVGKEIDKIQAAFLWGDSKVKKKVHLVKWQDVTMDKKLGGLGIRNLKVVNNCLLAKWWWRFGREDNSLWKQLICNKYRSEGGRWFPFHAEATNISRVWSDNILVNESNNSLFNYYLHNVELRIGNGERLSFWVDNWLGTSCLKSQFPRLYYLSVERDISLHMLWSRARNQHIWAFNFKRPLLAWEEDELLRLHDVLGEGLVLNLVSNDTILWKADPAGIFTVKHAVNWFESVIGPALKLPDLIWHNPSPPKA